VSSITLLDSSHSNIKTRYNSNDRFVKSRGVLPAIGSLLINIIL
jgi:hypothetical protein